MAQSIGKGNRPALDEPLPRPATTPLVHGLAHLANSLLHPHQDGPADNAVANIQFLKLRDGGHRLHILIIEAMAGMDPQAQLVRQQGAGWDR